MLHIPSVLTQSSVAPSVSPPYYYQVRILPIRITLPCSFCELALIDRSFLSHLTVPVIGGGRQASALFVVWFSLGVPEGSQKREAMVALTSVMCRKYLRANFEIIDAPIRSELGSS